MVRDMARQFARERLWPTAAERDRNARPPLDLLAEMGGLGLMGMCVPERWDGAGADFTSYVLAIEEIAARWRRLDVEVAGLRRVNMSNVAGYANVPVTAVR